jgi:hypothetical protein
MILSGERLASFSVFSRRAVFDARIAYCLAAERIKSSARRNVTNFRRVWNIRSLRPRCPALPSRRIKRPRGLRDTIPVVGVIGCLALVALCGGQAQPHGDQTLVHLDKLLKPYEALDLPMPPPQAPLKKTEPGEFILNGVPQSVLEVGYFLGIDKNSVATFMVGTTKMRVGPNEWLQAQPPIPLTAKSADKLDLSSPFSLPFQEDRGLALSIIERSRGHNDFARALWMRFKDKTPFGSSSSRLLPQVKADDPESRLKVLALDHWFNEIVNPTANRSKVLVEIQTLLERCPEMRTSFVDQTVRQLSITVASRYKGSDEIEKLIDGLCECQEEGRSLSSPDPSQKAKFEPLIELASRGYAAIPKLIEHAEDERLTRAISPAIMMKPTEFVTVGEMCLNIAEQFAPASRGWGDVLERKSNLVQWWSSASREPEREVCLQRLIANEKFLPQAPIRWAEHCFPDVLLEAYNEILKSGQRVETYDLLDAMRASTLDRRQIVEAASRGAGSNIGDVAHAAIWCLEKLDPAAFNRALEVKLQGLPKSATRPAWLSRDASFAQQTAYSSSPKVWAALTEATERADVDLRLELIQQAAFGSGSSETKHLLLSYWASFFSDPSSVKPDPPASASPSQHFGLPSLMVGHLAMTLAAGELGIKNLPDDRASAETWNAFRLRLLTEIH